jgi:hypothetical protein
MPVQVDRLMTEQAAARFGQAVFLNSMSVTVDLSIFEHILAACIIWEVVEARADVVDPMVHSMRHSHLPRHPIGGDKR